MKYGCRDVMNENQGFNNSTDTSFISLFSVNTSQNNCISNMTSDTLDTMNSSTSDDLSYVDNMVQDIMNRDTMADDNIQNAKVDVLKILINSLYEQIAFLKNEIYYLKTESCCKNSTIGQLLTEISEMRRTNPSQNPFLDDTNSSQRATQLDDPAMNSTPISKGLVDDIASTLNTPSNGDQATETLNTTEGMPV